MKRYSYMLLIFCYTYFITIPCFAQVKNGGSKILEISNNYISGNIGYADGVNEGDIFFVKRMINNEMVTIAIAQVIVVKRNISALKIKEIFKNYI